MASFDSINYSIRPNKAVERKLIFSALSRLSRIIDLETHGYIGFGSLWFVDFTMAHKLLGISSMISIESNEVGYRRGKFNKPLACIEMIFGESSLVMQELPLENKPNILWFDYDSSIGGPVLPDIQNFVSRAAVNSLMLVTLSAKPDDLPDKDENDVPVSPESALRKIAGDLVPTPLSPKLLQRRNYPRLISEIISNQFISAAVNTGRDEVFVKLFDVIYTDGTPMVTVGGIMAERAQAERLSQLARSEKWEGISVEMINVPPLTIREKTALDQKLPAKKPLTPADVDKIGFPLKGEQIQSYQRYYMHYPTFGEFQV